LLTGIASQITNSRCNYNMTTPTTNAIKARLAALDVAADLETDAQFTARLNRWRRYQRVDLSERSAAFMEGYHATRWAKSTVTTCLETWLAQVA